MATIHILKYDQETPPGLDLSYLKLLLLVNILIKTGKDKHSRGPSLNRIDRIWKDFFPLNSNEWSCQGRGDKANLQPVPTPPSFGMQDQDQSGRLLIHTGLWSGGHLEVSSESGQSGCIASQKGSTQWQHRDEADKNPPDAEDWFSAHEPAACLMGAEGIQAIQGYTECTQAAPTLCVLAGSSFGGPWTWWWSGWIITD